jgi:crossover junction endodeoxyribonuclease RuvC
MKTKLFHGDSQVDYKTQEDRFAKISAWAIDKIPLHANVFIEGYAYASKGVVFHIGENTGLLKHRLWERDVSFVEISPPSIKKFATGKGNSNKMSMYESFVKETEFDISATIHCNEGDSPMSDIIDSYYVAKYGFQLLGDVE